MNHKTTLLVGEPMGLFIAEETGRLEDVDHFSFTTCGAELNVAIGMKRLGHEVSYMTKLGRDPFGKRITNRMEEIGISTGHILFSDERPTGFMFKSMVAEGDPSIFYFRRGFHAVGGGRRRARPFRLRAGAYDGHHTCAFRLCTRSRPCACGAHKGERREAVVRSESPAAALAGHGKNGRMP